MDAVRKPDDIVGNIEFRKANLNILSILLILSLSSAAPDVIYGLARILIPSIGSCA